MNIHTSKIYKFIEMFCSQGNEMVYQEYFLLSLQNIQFDMIYYYKSQIKTKIGLMLQKYMNTYENTRK